MNTSLRIGYLGPPGTFGEEALMSQEDLSAAELVPYRSMSEILGAVSNGELTHGFVALENAIEGTVTSSLDSLIFDNELFIQREVELGIRMNLLTPPGLELTDVKTVVSFPHASAQCRSFLAECLPDAEIQASNSTAEAARFVGEERPPNTAAIGTGLAAELYGLSVLVEDVADHDGNETRFVLVAKQGIPSPTGHDKTSIVCFQHADRPGNLHSILGQFSARGINLTKLESRPTKRGLGDYCFVIDLEGHVADEVIADCLRELHLMLGHVKFLGSYPAAGEHGPTRRREAEAAWADADAWISGIRSQVNGGRGDDASSVA